MEEGGRGGAREHCSSLLHIIKELSCSIRQMIRIYHAQIRDVLFYFERSLKK